MQSKSNRKFLGAVAALAMALVVVVGASAPEQASALPKVKQAKFKVSIKGWQKNDWAVNHESTGRCDASDHSYGGEYATFKSKRPVNVTAMQIGKDAPLFVVGSIKKPQLDIEGKADVARNAVSAVGPVPDDCAVAGGGGEPVTPDCGLKEIPSYPLHFEYDSVFKDSLTLTSNPLELSVFNACGGGEFPYLLDRDSTGFPISSKLPYKELFDKRLGKIIVFGDGEFDIPLGDRTDKTVVHWEISFTRKGKKK